LAKIHPLKDVSKLTAPDLKRIYSAIPKVLKKSIGLKGDSMQDYRLPNGKKGEYQNFQTVYHREGKKCLRKDGGIIKRIKIGGRSAHFCPKCQKL
jgi:formamidopyrimidine-DNA glycosylase